jgi:hypothetical protein
MLKLIGAIGAVALLWQSASVAHASVVYDLTLTDSLDSTYDGTGTITLSSAPSATGLSQYSSASVTFTIDGEQFSGTATAVQFLDGAFRNAQFSEQIGTNPNRYDLQTTSGYAFYYDNELAAAYGAITATPASDPPSTPLPAALPLFATALGGLALLGWLRHRWPLCFRPLVPFGA